MNATTRSFRALRAGIVTFGAALAGCAGTHAVSLEAPPRSALAITAAHPDAQTHFDLGLVWCYAFHHAEASRAFEAALALDPACAMAHWGLAYAAGPHINNMEMSEDSARRAHEHVEAAARLVGGATELERDLVAALGARYAWPAPADRKALDQAYADAMRGVYAEHGANPEVAALYAEALMDLWPWDLWSPDGEPRPDTLEVVAVLERLLATHPDHPQGCHLYIHAVEASRDPGRAKGAADRLRDRVPFAGHLVHMPSHVDIRVGQYGAAVEANQRGIEADRAIVARTGREGFYEIYRAHNHHFLAYAAMFEGREAVAMQAARDLARELPPELVAAMPQFLDAFLPTALHVLIRFGRYEAVLAEPMPAEHLAFSRAVWHYARGVAFANLDQPAEAERERVAFDAAVAAVPDSFLVGNNSCAAVLAVGRAVLAGEVAFRAGRTAEGLARLREAAELDDALRYDEPWGWLLPARHPLGALLFEAGEVGEAEAVFREDLARHPHNGWALLGLAKCLEARGAEGEAAATRRAFEDAWRRADVRISASCACARR